MQEVKEREDLSDLELDKLPGSLERFSLRKLKQPSWTYSDLKQPLNESFHCLKELRGKGEYVLAVASGTFLQEESSLPEGVYVYGVEQANELFSEYKSEFESKCAMLAPFPFKDVGRGLDKRGFFIYIEEGTHLQKPIYILSLVSGESASVEFSTVDIVVGRDAQVSFISALDTKNTPQVWMRRRVNITVEIGSRCSWLERTGGNKVDTNVITQNFRVVVGEKGHFEGAALSKGSFTGQYTQVQGVLEGRSAHGAFRSLSLLQADTSHHQEVAFYHQEEETTSYQLIKTLVQDKGFSSFSGSIDVDEKAQKTDAYQLNDNVLLGEKAASFSCPSLEIRADDVKASHGCTSRKLDQGALFYLMSRGVSLKRAQQLLLEGFCFAFYQEIEQMMSRSAFERFLQGFVL